MKDLNVLLLYRSILLRKLADVDMGAVREHPEVKAPANAGFAKDSALANVALYCQAFEQAGEECPELPGVTLVALNLLVATLEEEGVFDLVGMSSEPTC